MSKVFTDEELLKIKMDISTVLDCVNMGGLAPYQAEVIVRRLNSAMTSLYNTGKTVKDNKEALNAIEDIRGTLDLFDEGYQYDETFGKDISDNLDIIEKYITQ